MTGVQGRPSWARARAHRRVSAPLGDGRARLGDRADDLHRPSLAAALEAARQASKRRKTATAFWPPKPKPLIIAVSTLVLARHEGHVVQVALGQVRVLQVGRRRR